MLYLPNPTTLSQEARLRVRKVVILLLLALSGVMLLGMIPLLSLPLTAYECEGVPYKCVEVPLRVPESLRDKLRLIIALSGSLIVVIMVATVNAFSKTIDLIQKDD